MKYALAPIIFLGLLTGAKADVVRDNFVFPIEGAAKECVTAEWIGLPGAEFVDIVIPREENPPREEIRLTGFHLPPKDDNKPLLLYFHGQGGFRPDHFKDFVAHGYGVMAFPYRGYHRLKGAPSAADILKDAEKIYNKALEKKYLPKRIVIIGESIGTGVATILASRHEEAALVLDSPYDNIPAAAETIENIPFFLRVVRFFTPNFLINAAIADKLHADDAIRNVKAPVFMSVGCNDRSITPDRSFALYERAALPKKLIVGACVSHVPLAAVDPRQSDKEQKERREMMTKALAWIDQPVDGGAENKCDPKEACGDGKNVDVPARAPPACDNGL